MSIKPFDLTYTELPDELTEILVDAGALPSSGSTIKSNDQSLKVNNARDVFNRSGANIDKIANTVMSVMSNGETDSGRLKAAELALKVHGVLQDLDHKAIPQITINIIGNQNKTLINLLMPTT